MIVVRLLSEDGFRLASEGTSEIDRIELHAEDGSTLQSEGGFTLLAEHGPQLIAELGFQDIILLPLLDTRRPRRHRVTISPYRLTPCPPAKVFTSQRTYTARCPRGLDGLPVNVTAIADSILSQQDADNRALHAAKCAAEGRLVCQFRAEASATGPCGRDHSGIGLSTSSQADADEKAAAAARAEADAWCAEFMPDDA